MFNQTIGCLSPNFSARRSLRLFLFLLPLFWTQFAHGPHAQALGRRPSLAQVARDRSVPRSDRGPRRGIRAAGVVVATGWGLIETRPELSPAPYPVATASSTDSPAMRLAHRRSRAIIGKTGAQHTQEVTTLEPGKPIERELRRAGTQLSTRGGRRSIRKRNKRTARH